MKKILLLLTGVMCLAAVSPIASAQKAKKAKKEVRCCAEILSDMQSNTKPTGNVDFDTFVKKTAEMANSFQEMSAEYANIKIETMDIPDAGDGVVTAIKITDAQGNTRTKESVLESNKNTALNIAKLTLDATAMAASGATLISNIVSDPMKAIPLAFGIKQMKLAIEALTAMSREIPVFAETVKAQSAAIAQAKNI